MGHSWYLSHISHMRYVEKNCHVETNLSCGEISNLYALQMWKILKISICGVILNFFRWQMWRNLTVFQHVESFQISPHDSCGEIWRFSTSGMCMMWRMSLHMYMLCCFVEKLVLSWFTLFVREICFVVIYALLCGENWTKGCICGEKNRKHYHVLIYFSKNFGGVWTGQKNEHWHVCVFT